MFYNLDYECNALPNMVVTGPVHCNGDIYLTPINSLTFNSDVTCTKTIYRSPKTGNGVGSANSGTVVYNGKHVGGNSTMTLPVGTNNSVAAVRQIVEPAPFGESADSSMGQLRFYNKADMLILVSNATVTVNYQPASRQGEYWRRELAADNGSSALWLSLTNYAVWQQPQTIVFARFAKVGVPFHF